MLPCLRSAPLLGQLIYCILLDIHRMASTHMFLPFKSTPRLMGTPHLLCSTEALALGAPPHPVDRPP
eukprot:12974876-Alexandrium_andersonii.AAC.1